MEPTPGRIGLDCQLSIDDMIERFSGTSRGSWAQMRFTGKGPTFTKVGKRVFYSERSVAEWLEANSRTSTADVA